MSKPFLLKTVALPPERLQRPKVLMHIFIDYRADDTMETDEMTNHAIHRLNHHPGHLSRRGASWAKPGQKISWLDVVNNLWDPSSNPMGFVSLGIAENNTMHEEILRYVNSNFTLDHHLLEFGDSLSGSNQLRQVMAAFISRYFNPAKPVLPENIVITSGVGPAIEALSFSICDPGDGVLLGRPFYRGFPQTMNSRAEVATIGVSFDGVDLFSMEAIPKYGGALATAKVRGQTVRALLLCNPHNPLGRCYSREVLREYMLFCQAHQIHLISDEIYACSVWNNPCEIGAPEFCSVLSIDTEGLIDPGLVHALWGMSKDFGSNGIRLGCIVSQRNDSLHKSLETNSCFTCPSSLSDRMTAQMLHDSKFMDSLIRTNQDRLAKRYENVTKFLKRQGISYETRSNAAIFVWADLFTYWRPRLGCDSGAALGAEQLEHTWKLESQLNETFTEHKLFLGAGRSFGHSEAGWFRITFALDFERLNEGFKRMATALEEFEKKYMSGFDEQKGRRWESS